ncbi:hypothetical protein QTP88_022733 [Uroleucon formosanum]
MNEIDIQHLLKDDQKRVLKFKLCEPKKFIKNSSHKVDVFECLQSLRKDEVLCDIKLETDDGSIVIAHKVVLASVSPYFRAMFTNFEESNSNHVNIRELDSTVLQLLVNYFYTGEIIVTNENVQVLLAAANFIQLDYVKRACVEFLQTHMDPSNCIGIKAVADLHNCTDLLTTSEAFIKKQFLEVVKYDEFLSLSLEEMIELISCNDLTVPFEENVFECVIDWVKYKWDRKKFLSDLMEHVRLPLTSMQYLLKYVVNEPLLENSKDYVFEALHFHMLKTQQLITVPGTIRCAPRQSDGIQNVTLWLDLTKSTKRYYINWHDPITNLWKRVLDIKNGYWPVHVALLKHNYIFVIGSNYLPRTRSVQMFDLFSESSNWEFSDKMIVDRTHFQIGVLNNRVYAVGGFDGSDNVNSAEVFDVEIEEWEMISSMSHKRSNVGVGVLNNLLYAVGGSVRSTKERLNSVEHYDPSLDTWTQVANMSICRSSVGIGVLDDVMYAIGGYRSGSKLCKSVEAYRPSVGVWTPIADLNLPRSRPGVFALDGFLCVVGGTHNSPDSDSVEIYNSITNTWKLMKTGINYTVKINTGLVFNVTS